MILSAGGDWRQASSSTADNLNQGPRPTTHRAAQLLISWARLSIEAQPQRGGNCAILAQSDASHALPAVSEIAYLDLIFPLATPRDPRGCERSAERLDKDLQMHLHRLKRLFCLLPVLGAVAVLGPAPLQLATASIADDAADAGALKAAAASGEQWAQYNYGKVLLEGKGTARDVDGAARMFAAAAAQGNHWAQFSLGELYLSGAGVSVDPWKAADLFARSAAQGNQWAQYQLGQMHFEGTQIPQDLAKARDLFEKSAAQDNAWAQLRLGEMYVAGNGVVRDLATGRALIEKSMAQGNLFAKVALANLIHYSSPSEAIKLLREAADAGNDIARRRLRELRG